MGSAENYAKQCLKGFPKQINSVLIYTVKNLANQICKKGSKKLPKLLLAANCINTASNELKKCVVNFIDKTLGIKHADDSRKIPHVCWSEKIIRFFIFFSNIYLFLFHLIVNM